MSPRGLQGRAAEHLSAAESGDRFVDLAIDLREWDGRTSILRVGGRWDRQEADWAGEPERVAVWKLQPAQYEAGRFFADWLRAYIVGERVPGFEDIYALLAEGGRGGGKTDFGVKACAMFAVAVRDRIVWDISPVLEETAEIEREMNNVLIPEWYHWLEGDNTWRLWNGSEIQLLSAYKPESLKRGRVDMWLLNEGQRCAKAAYMMARPRLGDTSGLGIITANPPREPKGRWVMEFHDAIQGGSIPDIHLIEFDNEKNPAVDWRSLELLKETFGEKDYRREVKGEFLPIGDLVFYAWSSMPSGNIRPAPEVGDITAAFTARHLGRPFKHVVNVDFQLSPHMASAFAKFYNNPDDPIDPLAWFVDEAVVEGTEDDLVDAWEAKGYDPNTTAIIADASGAWQDAERTKGRGSFDVLRRRGWTNIYMPDRKMKKNPIIIERVAATNARMCNSNGVRKLFSVPGLRFVCAAAKNWENRSGTPYRRSDYAHMGDCLSYFVWRFWPRKAAVGKPEYRKIEPKVSGREKDLGRF